MKYFAYCRKSTESEDRQALSLDSQKVEIQRAFREQPNVTIVEFLIESKSAKTPGRPIFNAMLERIKRGDADGIIAWHPDRLARNSVDGGLVIYMLDQGAIKDMKFANFTFENSSQGKFMLQIMFGYSKYYVDNLAENVRRGMRAKAERGWFPAVPPIGYMNDRITNTIIRNPEHFDIVKRLLTLALTGSYTAKQLCLVARNEWHYTTPKHKRMGGNLLSLNTTYRILKNVFYAGHFLWSGVMHKGNHEAMITLEEHERMQRTVFKKMTPRPKVLAFPYTGLMRCGECGLSITAERHTNRFGSHYVYYRCTKRRLERCAQPFIEARSLQKQLVSFVLGTGIPLDFERWIIEEGLPAEQRATVTPEVARASIERSITEISDQLSNLTDLRIRSLVPDGEFLSRRGALEIALKVAQEKLEEGDNAESWFEPLQSMISFCNCAVPWLMNGDDETRRIIIKTVGSNPTLRDKEVRIDKAKPFVALTEVGSFLDWCSRLHEVRMLIESKDKETMDVLDNIKEFNRIKRLAPSSPPPIDHQTPPSSPDQEADEGNTCTSQ